MKDISLSNAGTGLLIRNDTDSTTLIQIHSNGNVGIGTLNPDSSALLDVSSTTKGILLPRLTTAQVGAVATPADGLIVYDTDTDTIKLRANGAWASLGGGGGGSSSGTAGYVQIADGSGAFASSSTTSGQQLFWDTSTHRLGLGTTTPQAPLSVYRSTASTNSLSASARFEYGSTGTPAAGFGNVLQFMLHNSSNTLQLAGDFGAVWTDATSGSEKGALVFRTRDTATAERMRITSAGNVGIGTTTPAETLDVNGTVKATTYKGLASNFTRITATVSSTSTVAWGYSSYVACPAGYTLINWGMARVFSSGAFSGAGVSYHDCEVSGNSVRAAHFTQVVNANFYTTCFGLCVRD